MNSIYIYGASGHGLVVADIALACGYNDINFIDDGKSDFLSFDDIKHNKEIKIALGIGDNTIRAKLFDIAKSQEIKIVTLIHPTAIISSSATIGDGVVIMPKSIVNAKATIKDGVVLNTGCIVEHECKIGSFAHISPNVALAGNVKIGKNTHVGIGACVIQGKSIGDNCIIGAGSVVVKDICNNVKAFGNPCKIIEAIK